MKVTHMLVLNNKTHIIEHCSQNQALMK